MSRQQRQKKKSKTVRTLECKKCGGEFTDHISKRYCETCRAEMAPDEPVEEPVGDEVESVDQSDLQAPEHGEAYVKKVHVDPNRKRYDRPEGPGEVALDAARRRLSEKNRESKEERERKDPLRDQLEALQKERADVQERLLEIDDEIVKVTARLAPEPAAGTKPCFGKYDQADYECTDLCPLVVECRASTGETTSVVEAKAS